MKKLTLISSLLFMFVIFSGAAYAANSKKVLLAVYFDNPDYTTSQNAFRDQLEKSSKQASINIEFMVLDTQGSKELFIAQLKKMESMVDLIFTAGTPNCLAIKEANIKKPVIFSAVADPVGAKLVDSLEKPGANFTGSHCSVSADRQLSSLLYVLPQAKKIGLLFNPDDQAPASQVKSWKKAMATIGLVPLEFTIPKEANTVDSIAAATKPLVGKVDVIVTLADAKISAFGEGMIAIANTNKIPTYTSLISLVRKGALLSVGFDFAEGARATVPLAIAILKGADPAKLPVTTCPQYRMVINANTARVIGLTVPLAALQTASEVIE